MNENEEERTITEYMEKINIKNVKNLRWKRRFRLERNQDKIT